MVLGVAVAGGSRSTRARSSLVAGMVVEAMLPRVVPRPPAAGFAPAMAAAVRMAVRDMVSRASMVATVGHSLSTPGSVGPSSKGIGSPVGAAEGKFRSMRWLNR